MPGLGLPGRPCKFVIARGGVICPRQRPNNFATGLSFLGSEHRRFDELDVFILELQLYHNAAGRDQPAQLGDIYD